MGEKKRERRLKKRHAGVTTAGKKGNRRKAFYNGFVLVCRPRRRLRLFYLRSDTIFFSLCHFDDGREQIRRKITEEEKNRPALNQEERKEDLFIFIS